MLSQEEAEAKGVWETAAGSSARECCRRLHGVEGLPLAAYRVKAASRNQTTRSLAQGCGLTLQVEETIVCATKAFLQLEPPWTV